MIHDVDAALSEQLQARAARHGRSVEAELRGILTEALSTDQPREPNLADAIRSAGWCGTGATSSGQAR